MVRLAFGKLGMRLQKGGQHAQGKGGQHEPVKK
jgi:hypothetical protein